MRLDKEALYSLVVQPSALRTAAITPGDHVTDAFCGAGWSAIGFARSGKRGPANEMNLERLEVARYAAALFRGSERIVFWRRLTSDSSNACASHGVFAPPYAYRALQPTSANFAFLQTAFSIWWVG